jgi:hypothetical protein
MNEEKQQAVDNVKQRLDYYANEFIRLNNRWAISTLLFLIFLGYTIYALLDNGVSIIPYIATILTMALYFDGELIKTKLVNISTWVAVLTELHAKMEQAIKNDESTS